MKKLCEVVYGIVVFCDLYILVLIYCFVGLCFGFVFYVFCLFFRVLRFCASFSVRRVHVQSNGNTMGEFSS